MPCANQGTAQRRAEASVVVRSQTQVHAKPGEPNTHKQTPGCTPNPGQESGLRPDVLEHGEADSSGRAYIWGTGQIIEL